MRFVAQAAAPVKGYFTNSDESGAQLGTASDLNRKFSKNVGTRAKIERRRQSGEQGPHRRKGLPVDPLIASKPLRPLGAGCRHQHPPVPSLLTARGLSAQLQINSWAGKALVQRFYKTANMSTGVNSKKESSFLKKRSKKLLSMSCGAGNRHRDK